MSSIRPLPPILEKIAKEELNEDATQIAKQIEQIRVWVTKEPHINSRISYQFLLTFLRGCKHSVQRTKEKIEKFYTLRGSLPELFLNRNVEDPKVKAMLDLGVVIRIPSKQGYDGPRLNIIRPGSYNAEYYTMVDAMRVGTMMADIAFVEDDNAIIAGQIEILDLANVTIKHFFQIDLAFMKKLSEFTEQAAPFREIGMHFINLPPGFDAIFAAFKNFLSEKKKGRIFAHSKLETLYEYIPKDQLPREYGGESGSIKEITDFWMTELLRHKEYIDEEKNYGINENFRFGSPKYGESHFGVDGSFRSLNLD